jgi:hypothetical protein
MADAAKGKRSPGTTEAGVPPPEPERHICTVSFCPICLAVTAGHSVRPDAVEHLLTAGREFLLALSSIVGTRAGGSADEEQKATLTRIDIE